MELKTYQAYSMAEALSAVKRDLGHDAVILNTRSFARGGFLGLGKKRIIEVTATTAEQAHRAGPVRQRRRTASIAARRAYARAASVAPARGGASASRDEARPAPTPTSQPRRQRTSATLQTAQAPRPAPSIAPPALRTVADSLHTASADSSRTSTATDVAPRQATPAPAAVEVKTPAARSVEAETSAPVARRFILTSADASAGPTQTAVAASSSATETPPATPPTPAATGPSRPRPAPPAEPVPRPRAERRPDGGDDMGAMQDELAAIREMVGQVLQRQTVGPGGPPPNMPQALFDMYLKLVAQDLSEEIADQVLAEVRDELSEEELERAPCLHDAVGRRLAAYVPIAEPAILQESPDERPLTIALVGPTGVGKTTTLAKLAATFKLTQRRKVGLITCDTYRIAAVDQLRTYANIIGLPLQVALTPAEMRQAVHMLGDCDVILIDTAGRSQHDSARIDELKQFIEAADPHEVHLVLSSTAGEKVLLREAETFLDVGVDKIVLTKLDEAVSFGVLINVMKQLGRSLSFVTTGQEVPDHIEVGRSDRLAALVLGGDVQA